VKKGYAASGFVLGSIFLCILLLTSTFPIWQRIHASLQTGNTNEAASDHSLYSAWMYFRKYGLPTGNSNESSIRSDNELEAVNRSLILQEQSDDGTRLDPLDTGDITRDEQMLTPELVAEELRTLNSTQVADYPLHELSSDDILATFNLLSDTDIQKVLANTKPENLQIIFSKLPGLLQEPIFNRLDESPRSYVVNSIGTGVIVP
jgi:hypothetical protein